MADVIKFRCKSCDQKISVRAEYAGKKAKCPGCQKPLRVPSPRPKRSSTGVPIAAGATESDSGSSSDGAKSYTLADLAEMEANAEAELQVLSHKVRPNRVRIPNGKDCPECGSSCKPNAILCVHCGHGFDGGKKHITKKESKFSQTMRSVASLFGSNEYGGNSGIVKYGLPTIGFFIVSILCFTGIAGQIILSFPLEAAASVNAFYEDMGRGTTGGLFFGLAALSGGIWFVVKRVLLL